MQIHIFTNVIEKMETRWKITKYRNEYLRLRILSLDSIDKIRDHLIANAIYWVFYIVSYLLQNISYKYIKIHRLFTSIFLICFRLGKLKYIRHDLLALCFFVSLN